MTLRAIGIGGSKMVGEKTLLEQVKDKVEDFRQKTSIIMNEEEEGIEIAKTFYLRLFLSLRKEGLNPLQASLLIFKATSEVEMELQERSKRIGEIFRIGERKCY